MCELHNHSAIQVNIYKYDPTRTTSLRNAFVGRLNKQFLKLSKMVSKKVYTNDFFSLNKALNTNSVNSTSIEYFIQLLKEAEKSTLLDQKWVNEYLRIAYDRGITRARTELRKAGIDTSAVDDLLEETLGRRVLSNLAYHADMINSLYLRMFTELSGITTEMNTQIVRILTQGLVEGDSPRRLAQKINSAIIDSKQDLGMKITYTSKTGTPVSYFISGRRRAEILARTEIIRAHHLASITEYKKWGVEGIKVLAEFSTAKDGRVCPTCASLEGSIWTLDEATNLIPVHPQCRCVALPYFEK